MEKRITREKFEKVARKYIHRKGIDDLLRAIADTDFYIAPASRMYHESYEGGLAYHSYNTFMELAKEVKKLDYISSHDITMESVAICGLFHDLCKIGYYSVEMRNTKEDGKWIKVPYYTINDTLPLGHGEKSIIQLLQYIELTMDEMMAIRWHMGGYEPKENYNAMSTAYQEYPLAVLLHVADLKATYIEGVR